MYLKDGIRRAFQILREVAQGAHIVKLRLLSKFAHPHVVDHALTQRADGWGRRGHDAVPLENRGGLPKPVLKEALAAAKNLSEFVISAAKVFEDSRKLASNRILYGSRPLVEGESGFGRDQRAKRILRPARVVAKENAAIVNEIWASEI